MCVIARRASAKWRCEVCAWTEEQLGIGHDVGGQRLRFAFSKEKVFLRHIATGQTKRIGIRVKNLYKLEVDDCATLSTKAQLVQSQDIGELWHR